MRLAFQGRDTVFAARGHVPGVRAGDAEVVALVRVMLLAGVIRSSACWTYEVVLDR